MEKVLKIRPVILCGGNGDRLWPLSRSGTTKPFLKILHGKTLFQLCMETLKNIDFLVNPIIICNKREASSVEEQLAISHWQHDAYTIIQEPIGRGTAAAITLGAMHSVRNKSDEILIILPADLMISDPMGLEKSIKLALNKAGADQVVLFGIKPTEPHTGYGYVGVVQSEDAEDAIYSVVDFIEKPSKELAKKLLKSSDYYWNSGIFCFKASLILELVREFSQNIYLSCEIALERSKIWHNHVLLPEKFSECPVNSIDYAVMEKYKNSILVPFASSWSDVGSWNSIFNIAKKDESENSVSGNCFLIKTKNSYIHSNHRFVAAIGLENTVVIETEDALLVSNREYLQDVKEASQFFKTLPPIKVEKSEICHRPWGNYESILCCKKSKVKKITILPLQQISLQLHNRRSEHWIIIAGIAEVTRGEERVVLMENESIFIPNKTVHRIKNVGDSELVIIEIQYGDYLEEDDIVRLADDYGRI